MLQIGIQQQHEPHQKLVFGPEMTLMVYQDVINVLECCKGNLWGNEIKD